MRGAEPWTLMKHDLKCPRCLAIVPLEDVNVAKDIALCRKCEESFSFAEAEQEQPLPQVDLDHPPKGVWFQRTLDGFELGTTTRSGIAFFLVPFMCLWSGGSLGGFYRSQIVKGEFNLGLCLFGLPFLFGTILIGAITMMCVCGRICVRARNREGEVFAGIGRIGFRKRFNWDEIKDVRQMTRIGSKGQRYKQLCLETSHKPIVVGMTVAGERMQFFSSALRQLQQEFLPFAERGAKPPIREAV